MLFLSRFFLRKARRPPEGETGAVRAVSNVGRTLPRFFLAATLLASAVGCGASFGENDTGGSSEPTPPDPTEEETIAFVPAGTLNLSPSQLVALTVNVSPRRRQNVTFELLTETQGFDGFLLESDVRVRDDGTATVELRAPSGPARFTVRASLPEGSRALRSISVIAQGYGSIDVIPIYDGMRVIPQWTASARVGKTCESLESYFHDAELTATGSSRATITDVPSGVPVAITVRGGQLAAGCATVTTLRADDLEEVEIEVNDRPVDVSRGNLSIQLGIDSSTTIFANHLSETIVAGRSYFRGEDPSDAAALLARMSDELSGMDKTEFDTAISTHDLVDVVHNVYAQGGDSTVASPISHVIGSSLTDAASQITGPEVFRGTLTLQGATSQFLLEEVVGVDASASGFFQGSTWMVSAESGDMVVLGGTLSYEPLRWLGAIAAQRALGGATPSERITEAASCPDVSAAILSAFGGPPFAECDDLCLNELCQTSVEDVWEELVAQGPPLTTMQLGVSGAAELYGSAQIELVTGHWVGRLGTEDETSVGGAAKAELIEE